ncbi:NAD(P)/FAD-dependent oxidoreductase [Nonomuraea harbinensis]|uniref:NAD(P)/FAD-dependent oxidoreductase n=1 Tax=Nonomuraea harbinensis TaxID=1286938 RepID=A0ABW1BPF4_9ACTN|nr:FAD-dependent oxidoreductase [Nonomuraea harbinensis]
MRVVVIGSGIVGAAAAHRLSGRGVPVTVVDGAYPGQATQAGAGIVCPWVDHPDDEDWYRLTREGARHYPGLVSSLGESPGYARVGALLVAGEPSDLEPVRALLARRHAEAPEMGDVVDVAAPSALFPPLAEDLSALVVPGAARVDGRAVRDALLRAALRQGAELRTGTATLTSDGGVLVREVREADSRGRVTGVSGAPGDRESWRQATPGSPQDPPSAHGTHPASEASPYGAARDAAAGAPPEPRSPYGDEPEATLTAGTPPEPRSPYGDEPGVGGEGTLVEADVVIVAAGAWSGEVCRGLGVELPVFPRRGQIVHVTLEGVDTSGWPIVLPHVGPYLLGFPGSRVVVGATIEDVGFAPRVTMGGLDEVLRAGLRVAPGLSEATVTETRVGLRPVHAPGPPLIGPVNDRVIVATGLGAYGLTAGPFTGQVAAGLALGENPPLDLRPYHPRLH